MYNYFPNDALQNYHFCRIQLVIQTFEHPISWKKPIYIQEKSPKLLIQWIRKCSYSLEKVIIIKLWGLV